MSSLSLNLLGSFDASLDGEPIDELRSSRAQALLIYLAVERSTAHRREYLCTLLWPGMPEKSARHNLSQTLYALRQTIPEVIGLKEDESVLLLIADRQTVQLNPAARVKIDVLRMDHLLDGIVVHDHINLAGCDRCIQALEQVAALYQGEFLADFYLEDSNQFEDWAQANREAYRRKTLESLAKLSEINIQKADYEGARTYAQGQLDIDPLRESAYRQLMEVHSKAGQRTEALRTYQSCVQMLDTLLGTQPSSETTALYEIIGGQDPQTEAITPREGFIRGYEIRELLGNGRTGMVYRAYQPVISRDVAIKVILPQFANHPDFIRRFEVEAQLVARLEHPYIVPLYDFWRDPTGAYLVMRWFKGGNLEADLARGPWKPDMAVTLIDQIATALDLAHRQGVVHCDVKPANILLDEASNAYLADFGISILTGLGHNMDLGESGSSSGSLGYASPEVSRGLDTTPLADVYSLGVVLFELLTGVHPFPGLEGEALMRKHLSEPLPSALILRPELPPVVDEVIQKATDKDPARRFQDTPTLAGAFRLAFILETAAPVVRPELAFAVRNPYKGLRPFEEADAADFFGRDELVKRLLARLSPDGGVPNSEARFLAVVGPSGSGKSSVVDAGLIPAIRGGAFPGSERWFMAEMSPGSHPLEELETALLRIAVETPEDLTAQLEADRRGLLRVLRRALPDSDSMVLLVIDQFEELFTLTQDESDRDQFLDMLAAAAGDPHSPLRVLITLRADFYDRPLQHSAFGELVRDATEVVLPLSPEELERAICGPLEGVGVGLEPALVARIVGEVGNQPGTLPLLQYALTELFDHRDDAQLTLAAYEQSGGVLGALGRRAEEIYLGLKGNERKMTRQLFLQLVTLGEGIEDTRRRVLLSELEALTGAAGERKRETGDGLQSSIIGLVIDQFGRYRLLTFDHDPITRAPTVEVAHEAMLREWGRLRGWLDDSRDDIRDQRALARSANEWRMADRDPSFLLRGTRLDHFETWAEGAHLALTADERAFLEASLAARNLRDQQELIRQAREARLEGRSRRFMRLLLGVFAVATVIALILSGIAFNQRGIAQNNLLLAEQNATTATVAQGQALFEASTAVAAQGEAQHQAEIALTAQAKEASQKAIAEAAGAQAIQERELAEEQRRIAVARELASSALNTLEVDPERSILLALEAVNTTYTQDGTIILEAENALHQAIQASRILLTLREHAGPIAGADYSPDGTRIVTGSYDQTAKIWDAETGDELITLTGHNATVFEVAFSPDSSRVATAGYDNNARAWDAATGQELMTFSGHQAPINSVVFSPDDTMIATGSLDQTAKVWDVDSGEEIFTLAGHTDQVWHVEFNPDGTRIVTVGKDGSAIMWDTATGEMLYTLFNHIHISSRATFSQDGSRAVLTGNLGLAVVVDAISGEVILELPDHDGMVLWGQYSPDETIIATTSTSGKVRVFDAVTGNEWLDLAGHGAFAVGLDFNPEGTRLVTGSFDGTARVWDLSPERELITISEGHTLEGQYFTYHPDGTYLAIVANFGEVHLVDIAAKQIMHTFNPEKPDVEIYDIVFSPNGKLLGVAYSDGTARVWNTTTGAELVTLTGHGSFEYPGEGVTLTGINSIAFSPDGSRLATAGVDHQAIIWDSETGQELLTLTGHEPGTPELPGHGVTDIAFSPDGGLLGTTGADGTVRTWDADTGQELQSIVSSENVKTRRIAFSPDSQYLMVSNTEGTAKLFDTTTGQELLELSGPHTSRIEGIDFNPDGTLLVTSSSQGIIKVWDIEASLITGTGVERVTLSEPQGIVSEDIEFSPDGRYVAAIFSDRTVRIYVLDTNELLALAHSRVTRSLTEQECRQYLHTDTCP